MPPSASQSVTSRMVAMVQAHAAREALWAKGKSRSYEQFYARAAQIANRLCEAGVKRGDRVAILSGRNTLLYESVFAALLAGAAYTPLNPRFPVARNKAMLEASGAQTLIVDPDQAGDVAALVEAREETLTVLLPDGGAVATSSRVQVVDAQAISAAPPTIALPEITVDDIRYLRFTSGSTGKPKGVPITHGNVMAYLDGIAALVPVLPQDRLVQCVDVTFDLSAHDMFLAWTHGAALYSIPENAAALAPRFVSDYDLTGWLSVPSTAALSQQAGLLEPGSLPSLRFSYFCGEALPDAVAHAWADAANNSVVYNIYGPTEATIAFSYYQFDTAQSQRPPVVPIGVPLGEQRMGAFTPEHQPVPAGEIGELYLAGSQLTPGYWQAPEITQEKFVMIDGVRWYRTGDLVRHKDDGYHYVGRTDHQVKIQGFRVELSEIEAALRAITGNQLLAVVTLPADEQGIIQGVAAFITGAPIDTAKLNESLRDRLPNYMIPKTYHFIGALPLNSNGKTDYKALAAECAAKKAA